MSAAAATTGDPLPPDEVIGLARDPIALYDDGGLLICVNASFMRLFRPVHPFLKPGASWDMFLGEAHRHGLINDDTHRGLALIENRLIDRPGIDYDLLGPIGGTGVYRFRLTSTSDGGMALALETEEDPDEALTAERELEDLMAKVLEACPTPLIMARIGDGHILYRSPAATELLGKGLNSKDHFVHREERADFITALLPNARVEDMRFVGQRGDGASFPAVISAQLIDYRGEDVIVSSIDDLSDQIAMHDELARQREQIFHSEKLSALGELLAGVAHELNNPLSIVVGNAQILLEETEDPFFRSRLEKTNEAAERCVRIVKSFLSLARERPLAIAPVAADLLLAKAIAAFRAEHPEARVNVQTTLPADLPALMVDEVQIVQVLSNLLINAEHANEAHIGHVVITARHTGDNVQLRLADDGPGISPEIATRIFDPLFTTKAVGKGTGIGLALCHRIITAHKGRIALDPTAERGATFLLDLPAAE